MACDTFSRWLSKKERVYEPTKSFYSSIHNALLTHRCSMRKYSLTLPLRFTRNCPRASSANRPTLAWTALSVESNTAKMVSSSEISPGDLHTNKSSTHLFHSFISIVIFLQVLDFFFVNIRSLSVMFYSVVSHQMVPGG